MRPAAGQVDTDGDEVASSTAQLAPTSHRFSIFERPDVVSIGPGPPSSPTPQTPPLSSTFLAEMMDQLDPSDPEDLIKVLEAREQARVKSSVLRVPQRGIPKCDAAGCFRRRSYLRWSSTGV